MRPDDLGVARAVVVRRATQQGPRSRQEVDRALAVHLVVAAEHRARVVVLGVDDGDDVGDVAGELVVARRLVLVVEPLSKLCQYPVSSWPTELAPTSAATDDVPEVVGGGGRACAVDGTWLTARAVEEARATATSATSCRPARVFMRCSLVSC